MSRNINVNPGNYKVAGRERQGEDILQDEQKQAFSRQRSAARERARKPRDAPGAPNPRKSNG